MDEELISMVQECTNKYFINDMGENEVEIHIRIPKKFKTLWLCKLSELVTSEKEIKELEDE